MSTLTIYPTSDGDSLLLLTYPVTPTTHYTKIDETVTDDTDYNYYYGGAGTFFTDRYGLTDHTTEAGTISNVTVYGRAKTTYVGTQSNIKLGVRISSASYGLTNQSLTTSYATYSQSFNTYPVDSTTWTWAEVDALIAELQLSASTVSKVAYYSYCPQLWVVITYTPSGWTHISTVKGIAAASIATKKGIAVANIATIKGIAV